MILATLWHGARLARRFLVAFRVTTRYCFVKRLSVGASRSGRIAVTRAKSQQKMGRSEQGEMSEIRSSPNRPPVWPRGKQRPACSLSLQINSSLFSTRSTPISTATSGSGATVFTSLMEGRPPISPPYPIYRKTVAWVLPRTTTESIFPAWDTQIETGVLVETVVPRDLGPRGGGRHYRRAGLPVLFLRLGDVRR